MAQSELKTYWQLKRLEMQQNASQFYSSLFPFKKQQQKLPFSQDDCWSKEITALLKKKERQKKQFFTSRRASENVPRKCFLERKDVTPERGFSLHDGCHVI